PFPRYAASLEVFLFRQRRVLQPGTSLRGCVDRNHPRSVRVGESNAAHPSRKKRYNMDQHRKRNLSLVSAALGLMVSGLAMATVSAPPSAGASSQEQVSAETQVEPLQERPKPPQVAIDACRNRAEGDTCS